MCVVCVCVCVMCVLVCVCVVCVCNPSSLEGVSFRLRFSSSYKLFL